MAWDRTLRIVVWAFFCLMWIPLGKTIITPGIDEDSDGILMFLFLACLFLFIILLVTSYFGPVFFGWRESRIVREQGTLVPAVIKSTADTGMYINSQPVLEIVLSVHPSYQAAFEATVREVIPFSAIPQVQPGTKLEVCYIPGTTRVAMPA
jgi:membrane protease YdiL (CAAX protease family)